MIRCPVDAIYVPGISEDRIAAVGKLPKPEEVASLLLGRRSIRSFTDQRGALHAKCRLLWGLAPA